MNYNKKNFQKLEISINSLTKKIENISDNIKILRNSSKKSFDENIKIYSKNDKKKYFNIEHESKILNNKNSQIEILKFKKKNIYIIFYFIIFLFISLLIFAIKSDIIQIYN